MKKILIFLLVIVAVLFISKLIVSEKLPMGDSYKEADQVARSMLLAVNDSAWQQTGAVSWIFMGKNKHLWDKERHYAKVEWKDYKVLVNLNNQEGIAYKNDVRLEGKKAAKAINKAWKDWCNDSFWLNPVSKIFDAGTTRSMVKVKNGREGVMVQYSAGGATPGDSYVWLLDENNLPVAWKMWVKIIPIGGLEVPWSKWEKTATGVKICTLHDGLLDIELSEVKTAYNLEELTEGKDIFSEL